MASQSGDQASSKLQYAPETLAIHADDFLNKFTDVAPPIHVSTTFRYEHLSPTPDEKVSHTTPHIYSRISAPTSTRLEAVLTKLLNGPSLTYSSGLAALHALLVHVKPRRIAIGSGYHGCHGVIHLHRRLTGLEIIDLHADDRAWDALEFGHGDIVHVETPINPTGRAINLAHYAERAHRRGAYLVVDATFGPPGLQDPFQQGADVVMHSGTKYIGGHSDMLCGVLAVRPGLSKWRDAMLRDRIFLGSVMGSMEGWLGLRSLRTLELRVKRQSENALQLVTWLDAMLRRADQLKHSQSPHSTTTQSHFGTILNDAGTGGSFDSHGSIKNRLDEEALAVSRTVLAVEHASLQHEDRDWIRKQMPGGYGPVFAIWLHSAELAKTLPSQLELFHHATSLGGVESLIEWRRMSDDSVDDRLVRVSVGVESCSDLKDDLLQGFIKLANSANQSGSAAVGGGIEGNRQHATAPLGAATGTEGDTTIS